MTPFLGSDEPHTNGTQSPPNTLLDGTRAALEHLLAKAKDGVPQEALPHIGKVHFATINSGSPYFPSSLKQTEAISALKAVEAGVAASIADLRTGEQERHINVDLERASAFLFSTYLATVGGFDKANPQAKKFLKGSPMHVGNVSFH